MNKIFEEWKEKLYFHQTHQLQSVHTHRSSVLSPLIIWKHYYLHSLINSQQGVKAGGMLYISGCIGMDPATKALVPGGVAAQTKMVLENMKSIVEAGGSSMSKVVKCTVLITDMADFAEVNGVYAEYFPENPPARACFAVKGLPAGALVEIEAVAIA